MSQTATARECEQGTNRRELARSCVPACFLCVGLNELPEAPFWEPAPTWPVAVRIRIELVIRRIVVVSNGDQLCAFRYVDRLSEIVAKLPVEVIARDIQHDLLSAVGKDQFVFHILAAEMHVRRHPVQLRIDHKRELRASRTVTCTSGRLSCLQHHAINPVLRQCSGNEAEEKVHA